METEDIINFLLLAVFFSIILLYLCYSIPVNEYFENITPKDKTPTCSEAAAAINQVMRFIASDITGDGMIVINNFNYILYISYLNMRYNLEYCRKHKHYFLSCILISN
jgi:energy-converting hydrogenase Eha subunit H